MSHAEIEEFFRQNPGIYAAACEDDLDQLRRIYELYPDQVRLLKEGEALEISSFECRRCGNCCTSVRFITVCHGDVLRWIAERRWDILERLVVDRTKTPLMAIWGKESITKARAKAAALLEGTELDDTSRCHITQVLYVTDLVESVVYTVRENNRCTFFSDESNGCTIHDTKPRVCEKFPYYIGKYTDPKLIGCDFCPGLKDLKQQKA